MYRLPSLHRHLLHHLDECSKRCHCLGKPRCSFVVWVFVGSASATTESNALEADLCTRQISVQRCSGFSLVGGKRSSRAGSSSLRSEQPGLPRSGTAVVESSALPLGWLSLLELTPCANPTALEASGKPPDGRLPAVRGAQEKQGHPCWGCPANRRGGSEPANILSKREQGRKIRMA